MVAELPGVGRLSSQRGDAHGHTSKEGRAYANLISTSHMLPHYPCHIVPRIPPATNVGGWLLAFPPQANLGPRGVEPSCIYLASEYEWRGELG